MADSLLRLLVHVLRHVMLARVTLGCNDYSEQTQSLVCSGLSFFNAT